MQVIYNPNFCSILGAVIMGVGYYALMWGQIKDEEAREDHEDRNGGSIDDMKVPLLQVDEEDPEA